MKIQLAILQTGVLTKRFLAFLCAAPALFIGTGAQAQTTEPAAILAQAKQASGGAAWDGIQTLHIRSSTVTGGLSGIQDEWDDVKSGRYAIHAFRPPLSGAAGFDGVSVWVQPTSSTGYSYVLGDEDARLGAVNEAYQTCRAYWFAERAEATISSAGVRQDGNQSYDVMSITPQAGRPFTVWINQATHLIDRFVEQQGEDVQIIRLSDYRDGPGGLKLPYTVRIGNGDAQWDEVDTVQTVEINTPLAENQFALPPNPAPDFQFKNGKTSTTVPFRLDGDKILVDLKLNGQGPFEAELDSGGSYIIQPTLAKRLRLTAHGADKAGGGGESFVASGSTTVDTVDIGDIRLTRQAFDVLPFRASAPELALIGQQILERFVVNIDFDRQTLTLTRPDHFIYHGSGNIVPFHFQDNQPEIKGMVDGIAGVFAIDTGDDASLLLIAPFVRHYGLVEHYGATIPYSGGAIGGGTYGLMTRVSQLSMLGADGRPAVEVHTPLTRLSQQKRGFDADRYVSGNVGIGILRQFNLIFDYSRQQIIFEKNRSYGRRDAFNRTGLQLERNGAEWEVNYVVPGSPGAQIGIKSGEHIAALNGKNAAQLSGNQRYALFIQKAGTKIVVDVRSGAGRRRVVLTLQDVL